MAIGSGTKAQRWWGDHHELCANKPVAELNSGRDYEKLTALLRRYRIQKR
ncbi:hypothetical protein [Nocardia noduli]|nr:hypothetical protein [Nocardia noduli]